MSAAVFSKKRTLSWATEVCKERRRCLNVLRILAAMCGPGAELGVARVEGRAVAPDADVATLKAQLSLLEGVDCEQVSAM